MPRIIIDFPIRGIPDERNFPNEISDPVRKYFSGPFSTNGQRQKVFHKLKDLQTRIATIRIFAANELHELIIRYLNPNDVHDCVKHVIPRL